MAADKLLIRMLMGEIVIIHTVTKKSEMIQTSDSSGRVRHVMFSRENENWCCGNHVQVQILISGQSHWTFKVVFYLQATFQKWSSGSLPIYLDRSAVDLIGWRNYLIDGDKRNLRPISCQ